MAGVKVIVPGAAHGAVVVLDEPLSFWGGFSAERGVVIDEHHPQAGVSLSGAILVMEGGRGSSSASSVIAEAVRIGTAPAAILMRRTDEILATGVLVARELYGTVVPVMVLDSDCYARAVVASSAAVADDGTLTFS